MATNDALLEAVREAVRAEVSGGLEKIRQVVREELDREDADDASNDDSEEEENVPDGQECKLVICVRTDLGMSIGKTAAQVGHAVHSAVRGSKWMDLQQWEACGSKKIALKVESEKELVEVRDAARKAGLVAEDIQDAGHTELEPGTTTVLAIGPALDSRINGVTGHLKTVPDTLKRENDKLKAKNDKLQQELDALRKERKQLAVDNKRLLKLMNVSRYNL
eukprot:gnl/MRDRNA2_/MRDRNA2_108588_c0_seq1.p1 gnl/MRDRNA2_/MRDRNA2_108588_c0~~gnl/MRDRNA2_/MRDRNA2_108588_c0_seq1.p1  ORF type:complete len:241 (+),score=70.38 gnl/MRDRNA2_/MRDRNA2_108588_c0_seq1:63-725(+)